MEFASFECIKSLVLKVVGSDHKVTRDFLIPLIVKNRISHSIDEVAMTLDELSHLIKNLTSHGESEWVEFKCNKDDSEQIGEYISALSNSAALHRQPRGYLVWGIDDATRQVVGTKFSPKKKKVGGEEKNANQELESWLLNHLTPGIEANFHEGLVNELPVVVFEIQAAFSHPIRFKDNEFIRVGTYKKKLKEYPEKERKLWEIF